MAAGDATAADVPARFDVVLNGKGYVFADTVEPSLPFRTHRAIYDITPTFVQRQNVSNAYGDNAQDFFLTARNRDWSLGEQQKFFRSGQDGRYWMGQNIDVSIAGQAKLAPASSVSSALSEAVVSGCRANLSLLGAYLTGATTLFAIDGTGTPASLGAHGLGVAPAPFGVCTDGQYAYMSSTAAGTVGVRKWNGAAFSTFSATGSDCLAFLDNTLYGLQGFNSGAVALVQYDGAGTATTLFTWKGASNNSVLQNPAPGKIEAYGGKLLILMSLGQDVGSELWIYDGTGVSRLEVFPANYWGYDIEVLYGVAYISGVFFKAASASTLYPRPAIHFFDGSQVGLLWQANDYSTTAQSGAVGGAGGLVGTFPALTMYDGMLLFTDDTTGNVMAYSPARGGVSTIGTYTVSGNSPRLITSGTTVLHTRNQTTFTYFPATTYPSSGYVISSLIDFDSSLVKQFRGVTVTFDSATNGDGGSVDIAYQVDSLSGSWTTLRTGATSGTEYTFSGVSGHAVAIRITINKGTSTTGPVLKSLNVRAAPILKQFRSGTYILDCTGSPEAPRLLRDGSSDVLTGYEQIQNLFTLAKQTTPFTVTDRVGTFTALVDLNDPEGFDVYEEHPAIDNPQKSGAYLVRIKVREV